MKRRSKLWLASVLCVVSLVCSCSKDSKHEPQPTSSGATVTLSLNLEASVEHDELRALDFQVGVNTLNQLVPIPKFTDNQLVPVHTIIRGNNGAFGVATINWKFNQSKGRLILETRDPGNEITIANFNNDTEWYVSGIIGGRREGTQVKFENPRRTLEGAAVADGVELGQFDVPYVFGWTKLTLHTLEGANFKVADAAPAVFKPRGAFIGFKLGNKLENNYTFTPTGFSVTSNAFSDKGSFELNAAPVAGKLPAWTESTATSTMTYKLATSPGAYPSDANKVSDLTYYAWVMPTLAAEAGTLATASNRIMLKGTSSKYDADQTKDYTKTYFTDYLVPTVTKGKVSHGRVHRMTARATKRVVMPIEYVSEYMLAGQAYYSQLSNVSPLPSGMSSTTLKLVDPTLGNSAAGYYNWYELTGTPHPTYNPGGTRNLQTSTLSDFDDSSIVLNNKYFIPEVDSWNAIFPAWKNYTWTATDPELNQEELVRLYSPELPSRMAFATDYSKAFYPDGTNASSNAVIYAIRFKAHHQGAGTTISPTGNLFYDLVTGQGSSRTYVRATNDVLKCAYRFTRVKGRNAWERTDNSQEDTHMVIHAVYLGEDTTIDLADISNETWWHNRFLEGKAISRIFPATGLLVPTLTPRQGELRHRGKFALYWALTALNVNWGWTVSVNETEVDGHSAHPMEMGVSVRLFKKEP